MKTLRNTVLAVLAGSLLVPAAAAAQIRITLEPNTLTVGPGEAQDILVRIRGTRSKDVRLAVCNGERGECFTGGSNFLGTVEVVGRGSKNNPIVRYTAPAELPSEPPCTLLPNGCQLQIRVRLVGTRLKKFAAVAIPDVEGPSGAGVLEAVSVHTDGTPADSDSGAPSVSTDGRFIAFQSWAANLVQDDTNGYADIFLRDTCMGAPESCAPSTVRVSLANDGSEFNVDAYRPSLSADGRAVAFTLVDFFIDFSQVALRDTCLGTDDCTPGTLEVTNWEAFFWGHGGLSATGRFLTFSSETFPWQVFLKDTCFRATDCLPSETLVSTGSGGFPGNDNSLAGVTSATGRYVAFVSDASNLVGSDSNGKPDVFWRDTCLGALECAPSTVPISTSSFGQPPAGGWDPSMTADGSLVAFVSKAKLVEGDTNKFPDVFLGYTSCAGDPLCAETFRVSVSIAGTQANGASFRPSVSADGRYVAFASNATNLVTGDRNGVSDVFVRDTCLGAPEGCVPTTVRVSVSLEGVEADGDSFAPVISADGQFVIFVSRATNLVEGHTGQWDKVFLARTGY